MIVNLVQIGNSRGVRIPKVILEQCGFVNEAELEVKRGSIVISPIESVRSGWKEAVNSINAELLEAPWEW